MRDALTVATELAGCSASRDTARLAVLMDALEVAVLLEPQVSPSALSAVRDLLGQAAFLDLQDSWRLPRFIDNNWDLLSPSQREDLRDALVGAFDKYADWMGAFVTSEILGRRYADDRALQALTRLGHSAQLPARSLAAHGLEVLALEAPPEALREPALEQIRVLVTSDIEEVRTEAIEALSHMSGKGTPDP